ncbi:MAG: hypothetical protein QOE60_2526 [Thermoleophilaceae bacterium]|nr:hypothetical protein [Thermoleophilaceae bacterium]
MRRQIALGALGAALIAAAPAEAATLTLDGSKSCYRLGDTITLNGSGFTPNGQASITLDGKDAGIAYPDAAGNFSVPFGVGTLKGQRQRTLIATDAANPANVAQAQFLGSSLGVIVRPQNGAAGRKLRINASGFTTGKRLYAHVVRKRYRRNVFVGKLKGACRTLKARKRVTASSTPSGHYTVQFDTKRRYSKKTKVWVRFSVDVTQSLGGAGLLGQSRLTQTVLFSR